ncbi:MAG TPA: carboxypeptidase regulatory-like domain-containing protein [Pyrinomonadaceae bacterium]|nr:carboxypeptidase regulatory-like domain-containing protein [Pyrinomonadaceae bacterium]
MKLRGTLHLVLLVIFLLLGSQIAFAQQSVTSASLSGVVQDASGAVVADATLTATKVDTNREKTARTDDDGRYRFPYLPVGEYRLAVNAPGFEPFTQALTLTVGQSVFLPVKLVVAGFTEKVDVTDAPTIETVRTQVTETIQPAEIDRLPLNGRNFLDLAVLVPGVSPTNTGSNQRFAETSAVPGQGISVAGQRNLYNSFIVDGVSANDDAADLTGTYFGEEVIREFQVITSGGIAEFGRASGGVVNIITRSGTNSFNGSLYGFARNQRFDARNPVAPVKDLLTQAQYGATISGPLRRDRTFLFSNFEQTRRNYSAVITVGQAAVASINSRLNAVNFPGPRLETGVAPASFDTTNVFARLDHSLTKRNQLNARYSLYHIVAINSRTVGGLNTISRGSGLTNTDQTFQVSNITTLSNRSLNETRFQYTRSRLDAPINDSIGPAVGIAGVANFGTATSSPLARDIDMLEVVENISRQSTAHSIKGGADFLYNRVNIVFPGAVQGSYSFSSLANFLTGSYSTFQQAFGAPSQFQANQNFGMFIQDEWRVRSHLTLNAGLRYDVQFLPEPIKTDRNNFAPRFGFAYAPGDRKTVLRGSFGIYFDRIPLRATSNALQRDGSKYVVTQLAPGQVGAPVFPNVLTSQPTGLVNKPNITRIDPLIEPGYSEQASLQIERELPGDSSLSVGYLHLRGLHLVISRNVNVPRFAVSAGVPNQGRPDLNWGNISRYESSGDSYYDGMIVSFNKRTGHWATVRVSYTLSKAIDDTGNFFFSTPQDNFDVRGEQGLSDNDQRHRLVVSGSFEAPSGSKLRDFQMSYIFTAASRLPFNVLLGNDRNLDSNNNDRPVGVGRNTGKGFGFSSLDLRLRRRIKLSERVNLEMTAECFNVLNHANFAVPINVFGPGTQPAANFGQPSAAFDPRQFQFGLRLNF